VWRGEQSATAALITARKAVRAFPSSARGYLLLARAYVAVGNFPLALAALNVAPSPPLSPPSPAQAAFVIVAPVAAQRTYPRERSNPCQP
jgi:cytochrome c-type biogenesis protein CcmH/NrfG